MAWYLRSTKTPNLKFKIVELDKTTMRAKLQGDTGVPFERDIGKETLAKYHYEIVRADDEQPAQV